MNGCLSKARIALETLALSMARARPGFYGSKWGHAVMHLRKSGLITEAQEAGLTGVYSLISPGSHKPVAFDEQEYARLGRNLAVTMCYFLAKCQNNR